MINQTKNSKNDEPTIKMMNLPIIVSLGMGEELTSMVLQK
jgi:hypothetical protein